MLNAISTAQNPPSAVVRFNLKQLQTDQCESMPFGGLCGSWWLRQRERENCLSLLRIFDIDHVTAGAPQERQISLPLASCHSLSGNNKREYLYPCPILINLMASSSFPPFIKDGYRRQKLVRFDFFLPPRREVSAPPTFASARTLDSNQSCFSIVVVV